MMLLLNGNLRLLRSFMDVCYLTLIILIISFLSLNYLFDILNKISKNFIGSMFCLQLIKLLIMLLLCGDIPYPNTRTW